LVLQNNTIASMVDFAITDSVAFGDQLSEDSRFYNCIWTFEQEESTISIEHKILDSICQNAFNMFVRGKSIFIFAQGHARYVCRKLEELRTDSDEGNELDLIVNSVQSFDNDRHQHKWMRYERNKSVGIHVVNVIPSSALGNSADVFFLFESEFDYDFMRKIVIPLHRATDAVFFWNGYARIDNNAGKHDRDDRTAHYRAFEDVLEQRGAAPFEDPNNFAQIKRACGPRIDEVVKIHNTYAPAIRPSWIHCIQDESIDQKPEAGALTKSAAKRTKAITS
jgi:hypothetical protein